MSTAHHTPSRDPSPRPPKRQERLRGLVRRIVEGHRENPEAAIRHAREALRLADRLRDRVARAEILLCLGRIHARQGEFGRAEELLGEALQLVPRNKHELCCQLFIALGATHFLQERSDIALEYYYKGLACDAEAHKGTLYLNIANVYFTNRNYPKSLHYQEEALRLARRNGDRHNVVYCLSNIGAIHVNLKENEKAHARFREALAAIDGQAGNDYMRCSCQLNLGEVNRRLGRSGEAEDYYRAALRLAKKNKLHKELAKGYQYLGELQLTLRRPRSFLNYQYRCRRICQEYGFDGILIAVQGNLQRYFESIGDYARAYGHLKEITQLRNEEEKVKREKALSRVLDTKEKEISILEEKKREIESQKRKLQKTNRELEKYNRELEQYAYVVAHDLKEPLRNISSFTSLIEQRYVSRLDDTAREYMGYVVRNVSQMHSLLSELLRYNTLDRKGMKLREVDLGEVVHEVIDQLQMQIRERNARIRIGELPRMRVHHVHATQLFQNLIQNALQFNESDPCSIRIGCRRTKGVQTFWVEDNGIGIQPEYHDKIFKLFSRLDRENYDGTGIGLALCKKIVQIYEGDIWIESTPDKGSTFFFTLKD